MSDWKRWFSKESRQPKPKLGRNDPCWCGSGKKYKKCHLASDELKRAKERAATFCTAKG